MNPARFKVLHRTTYAFPGPVTLGDHRLMLRPNDSHDLRLISAALRITPDAEILWHHDVFGNSVGEVRFSDPTERLEIESELVLERYPMPASQKGSAQSPSYPFTYKADDRMDLGTLIHPDYPGDETALRQWLADRLGEVHGDRYDAASLMATLNTAIKGSIDYQERHVEGTQTPLETITLGTGTCRDFAALMIDAARTLGYGARFVTGYLYSPALDNGADAPKGAPVGASATHAWAEIYMPSSGWVSYDPTNDLIESADLIRIAVVRTARQAKPISGSFTGPVGATMDVAVEITSQN